MGYNLENYFAEIDFNQVIGDAFRGQGWTLTYSVDGTNFSFTNYTIDAKIYEANKTEF